MTTLDRFESLFLSAAKDLHEYEEYRIDEVLVVTDTDEESTRSIVEEAKACFGRLAQASWRTLCAGDYADPSELLAHIQDASPQLICSYRHLHTRAKEWPYSLGSYMDVMAQVTPMPLLALPHPTPGGVFDPPMGEIRDVLVVTDHISDAGELVNVGARLVAPEGRLVLAHVEDDATFERYARIIARIPGVETEQTIEAIRERLMREASDYIDSCKESLAGAHSGEVIAEVRMGHRIADIREMIDEHEVDLVVFDVKDDNQLAMHGLAYPLAIELRDLPIVMV